MADSRKRIALKPHMARIREWVETGKTDDWIADALGTSASSVQSFRSRNDIYRRERGLASPRASSKESSTTANVTVGAFGSTLPSLRTPSGRSTGQGLRPSS